MTMLNLLSQTKQQVRVYFSWLLVAILIVITIIIIVITIIIYVN